MTLKPLAQRLDRTQCDQLIKDLAVRLSNFVDPVRQVARIAESEFGLILEYEEDNSRLNQTLNNLLQEVARPVLSAQGSQVLSASVGVTIVQHSNLFQLLKEAYEAIKKSEQLGTSGIQFFHESSPLHSMDRQQMENDLHNALAHNQFSLDYQPKLNLDSEEIDSVEVFVRWCHPEHGVVHAEDFLPLAEELGVAMAVCDLVINRVCQDMIVWRDNGLAQTLVSINLSCYQSLPIELYAILKKAIALYGLPPAHLELEFSENQLMADIDYAVSYLDRLSTLGVGLAMDDFGIGYSALSHLERLPIDTLKIDPVFIADAKEGQVSPVIEALMAMAESLGLVVVAEGVESELQLSYLKRLGCHYAQGEIISAALPAVEISALMRDSKLRALSQTEGLMH